MSSRIALGAGVFCKLEGVSAVDGLYWAAITASTVGYGDVLAKTDEGMIFSCFFILVGCTIMANVISLPTDIYMGRQQRKKMEMVDAEDFLKWIAKGVEFKAP